MSHLVVFLIVIFIALFLGAIAVVIYINVRKPVDAQGKKVQDGPVIGMIMGMSFLVGLVVFFIYFASTRSGSVKDVCPSCILTGQDIIDVKKAKDVISGYAVRVKNIPMVDVNVKCPDGGVCPQI